MSPELGNALWAQLHLVSQQSAANQEVFFVIWLARVKSNMSCESCFRKLVWFMSRWPVDYGSGFHLWGICLHDFVNKELGRNLFYPEITIAPLTSRGIIQ